MITLVHPDYQWGSCCSIISFMCMFCRQFALFLLAIVLSVLLRLRILIIPLVLFQTLLVINRYQRGFSRQKLFPLNENIVLDKMSCPKHYSLNRQYIVELHIKHISRLLIGIMSKYSRHNQISVEEQSFDIVGLEVMVFNAIFNNISVIS